MNRKKYFSQTKNILSEETRKEMEHQIHQINLKIVHLEQKKEAIRRRTNYALEQKDEAKIKAASKARSRFQMNGEQQQLESWSTLLPFCELRLPQERRAPHH